MKCQSRLQHRPDGEPPELGEIVYFVEGHNVRSQRTGGIAGHGE